MTAPNEKMEIELKAIKKDLKTLKERMVNIDSIMTEDDYKALLDYRDEKKTEKLIPHPKLKKKLVFDVKCCLF